MTEFFVHIFGRNHCLGNFGPQQFPVALA
jgi:hypothetical protein